jgi:polyferredoxin
MRGVIPYLRRMTQALSFLFLLFLIIETAFPLEIKIPVDLYLRLDPFIGIVTILTKKDVILRMLPAFGVLLFVMIFGNFFCGWFCPMGSTIDFFDRILFRENDIYDVEHGILSGKIRRTWPKEGKYEIMGTSLDRRPIGIVCRITGTGKVRVITVYEDKTKGK